MRQFQKWWGEQLLALVPPTVIAWSRRPVDAVLLDDEIRTVRVRVRRAGTIADLGNVPTDSTGAQRLAVIRDSASRLPRAVLVRPSASGVLRKSLRLPLAAQTNLRRLLHHEIDHETPFDVDEVFWDFVVRDIDAARGQIDLDLLVVPRAAVAAGLDLAVTAGLAVTGIEVVGEDGRSRVIAIDGRGGRAASLHRSSPRRLAALAAAAVIALTTVPFARQYLALTELEDRIAELRPHAEVSTRLRLEIDKRSATDRFIDAERAKRASSLELLAAATEIVPDNSHLSEFSLRGERITLTGVSTSAAALVKSLAATRTFTAPALAAPVMPTDGGALESFTISAIAGARSAP